jgi:hypothetical protein
VDCKFLNFRVNIKKSLKFYGLKKYFYKIEYSKWVWKGKLLLKLTKWVSYGFIYLIYQPWMLRKKEEKKITKHEQTEST